jgi:hypothetical protein
VKPLNHAVASGRRNIFRTESERVVYIALRNNGMLSRANIARLTRYSLTQVARAVHDLEEKGLVQSVGYLFGEEILAAGPGRLKPIPDLAAATRQKFKKGEVFGPYFQSSTGFRLKAHAFNVGRGAAWVCEGIHNRKHNCLFYAEAVLRDCLGWRSDVRENEKKGYRTTVPDGWFVMPGFSFRLEMQMSPKSREIYRKVIEDGSHREPILYLTHSESIVKSLRKLHEEEGGKFQVALMGSEKDFDGWWTYIQEWRALEGGTLNPQRQHCSRIEFRRVAKPGLPSARQ